MGQNLLLFIDVSVERSPVTRIDATAQRVMAVQYTL